MRETNQTNPCIGQEDQYIRFAENSFSWNYIEKPALDRHLNNIIRPAIRVLDAGCGPGRIIRYLTFQGVAEDNIIGIDLNAQFIATAHDSFPSSMFIQGDISDPELENYQVDLITCSMVLQHIDQEGLKQTMRNFHRWIIERGILFYVVTHPIMTVRRDLSEYFRSGWTEQESPWGTVQPHYHRTVCDYINATIEAGFFILAIDEPEVVKGGEAANPDEYIRYTSAPSRLMIKAVKLETKL